MNHKNTEKELSNWKLEALQEIRARAITDRHPDFIGQDKTGELLK